MQEKLNGFFLGSSSPEGFTSLYDELYNPHEGGYAYIIKGGPGTGKSSLMKRLYYLLLEKGIKSECIFCSSDPDSLDALIIPELKCCIMDGTPPHTAEPKYFGVCEEFINLGSFLKRETLSKKKEKIISLTDLNKAHHKLCKDNLKSASIILNEIEQTVSPVLLKDKIESFAFTLCENEFSHIQDSIGKDYRRFISAPTSKGILLQSEKINELCDRFYIIEDEYYYFTKYFLSLIKNFALEKGFDVISSSCAVSHDSAPIHLLIPKLKLGFIQSNRMHKFQSANAQYISSGDFLNLSEFEKIKDRLSLMLNAHDEFIKTALINLEKAKIIHDDLEKEYIESMDFSSFQNLTMDIFNNMLK